MRRKYFARIAAAVITAATLLASSCSVPNLETPECTDARLAAQVFYAFHFGRDMAFSQAALESRSPYLTPEFREKLAAMTGSGDVFTTATEDHPKAFRIGKCRESSPERAVFEVLLFWKDDVRTEQRGVEAEFVKRGDRWLLNEIKR